MSERTNRGRRVSAQQLEILWEYLNSNKDLACAYNRSLQAKEYSRRKWREIAETLNSQGDGVYRDWSGWSKYWIDYKAKLKTRVAALRQSVTGTGGGGSKGKPLDNIEKKILQILGEDFGQGLPGVRVEPFAGSSGSGACNSTPTSESILLSQSVPMILESPPQNAASEPQINPIQGPPLEDRPIVSPHQSPPASHPAVAAHSLRRRRSRRVPPMSHEAARRALVTSSQMRAEAALRSSEAFERMSQDIANISSCMIRIER